MDDVLIKGLGFEKYTTKNQGVYYCGWLENNCIEVVLKNTIEINYMNDKGNYAKLCEFKKDVDLKFLERYLTSLILVLS